MTIYDQLCRKYLWIDHRTPLPLGQILPPAGAR